MREINVETDAQCDVCGGISPYVAELEDGYGEGADLVWICPSCLRVMLECVAERTAADEPSPGLVSKGGVSVDDYTPKQRRIIEEYFDPVAQPVCDLSTPWGRRAYAEIQRARREQFLYDLRHEFAMRREAAPPSKEEK